jgi:hypothetical protein
MMDDDARTIKVCRGTLAKKKEVFTYHSRLRPFPSLLRGFLTFRTRFQVVKKDNLNSKGPSLDFFTDVKIR